MKKSHGVFDTNINGKSDKHKIPVYYDSKGNMLTQPTFIISDLIAVTRAHKILLEYPNFVLCLRSDPSGCVCRTIHKGPIKVISMSNLLHGETAKQHNKRFRKQLKRYHPFDYSRKNYPKLAVDYSAPTIITTPKPKKTKTVVESDTSTDPIVWKLPDSSTLTGSPSAMAAFLKFYRITI